MSSRADPAVAALDLGAALAARDLSIASLVSLCISEPYGAVLLLQRASYGGYHGLYTLGAAPEIAGRS
jgi:hypothetical protein